jgi:hypothetical protein
MFPNIGKTILGYGLTKRQNEKLFTQKTIENLVGFEKKA